MHTIQSRLAGEGSADQRGGPSPPPCRPPLVSSTPLDKHTCGGTRSREADQRSLYSGTKLEVSRCGESTVPSRNPQRRRGEGRGEGRGKKEATFKWSRDNGSVATAWTGVNGNDLQVAQMRGFETGTWVELSDDVAELRGKPGLLVKVLKVDNGVLSIDPTTVTGSGLPQTDKLVNPKVRRWDQTQAGDIVLTEGAIPVKESPTLSRSGSTLRTDSRFASTQAASTPRAITGSSRLGWQPEKSNGPRPRTQLERPCKHPFPLAGSCTTTPRSGCAS